VEKFFCTLMYTLHMGGRWYTSYLYIVTRNVLTFVQSWHQGMYAGIGETGVKCLWPEGDSQHVSICCRLLARQVLHKVSKGQETTWPHSATYTCDWLQLYIWEAVNSCSYIPNLCTQALVLPLYKCLNASGDYMLEVWCVPSATRVLCIHWSRNKCSWHQSICYIKDNKIVSGFIWTQQYIILFYLDDDMFWSLDHQQAVFTNLRIRYMQCK